MAQTRDRSSDWNGRGREASDHQFLAAAVARECRQNNQCSVQNETAVASYDLSVCGMTPPKSQKLQTLNLASVVKEMAKPRLAKSTRAKETKGKQSVKIRLKPVLAKTSRGKFPVQIGID
jgi:hypothetical protein